MKGKTKPSQRQKRNNRAWVIGNAELKRHKKQVVEVKLKKGDRFDYSVDGYETCVVPATGLVDVTAAGLDVKDLGGRGVDVWDGEPEGFYVPAGAETGFC